MDISARGLQWISTWAGAVFLADMIAYGVFGPEYSYGLFNLLPELAQHIPLKSELAELKSKYPTEFAIAIRQLFSRQDTLKS